MTKIKVEYLNHMGDDLFVDSEDNQAWIGWAAGILEGEGCFSMHTRGSGKRNGKVELAIHCEMTDQDTILKLQKVLGVGTVCFRENKRKDGRTRKPSWILSIQKQSDILSTLMKVSKYMSSRRSQKISEMLQFLFNKFC